MRRRLMPVLVALTCLVTAGTFAAPAQAASRFTFDASPEPVKKGGYVKLAGQAAPNAEIDFYFKASGARSWVYQNYADASAKGRYSRRQAQNHSGTWKAVEWLSEDAKGAIRTDQVEIRGVQLPGVVAHHGDYYGVFKTSYFDPSVTTAWWFTGVRWTKLTMTSGSAVATMHSNDCDPDCASGRYHTHRVHLDFRRVRSHHGAPMFTEFRVGNDTWWTPLTPQE